MGFRQTNFGLGVLVFAAVLSGCAGRTTPPRTLSLPSPATEPSVMDWTWPVPGGELISAFGTPRGSHRHEGIDVRGTFGAPVIAALAGRVTYSGSGMRGYGKTVVLEHAHGLRTLYAHNSALLVRVGQQVNRGSAIARIGQTGNATTPHVHFEMQRHLTPFDPLTLRVKGRS